MTASSTFSHDKSMRASALLFITAFVVSLFFNGFFIQYYAVTMVLLFAWLLNALLAGYKQNHMIVISPLDFAIFAFLGILAITLLYHPVPYLGMINFWWVGIFGVVSTVYALLPASDRMWKYSFFLLMLVCIILATWGWLENLLYHVAPAAVFYNKNSLAAMINLSVLPLAANYFIAQNHTARHLITAALLLLSFVLGIIASRGSLLAFGVAILFLVTLSFNQVERRKLILLSALLVGGFILSMIYTAQIAPDNQDVLSRMATLANPDEAGNPRFLIWRPAWEMLQERPWSGIGLGAFFLAFPASDQLHDTSAGYYVHNDYLQIAAETGLPGLFFLLCVIAVLLWQFRRYLRSNPPGEQRLEALGLFTAVLSLGIHSFFTYNLYILPLMMLVGLYLARLNQLYTEYNGAYCFTFNWKKHFHPRIFYFCSFALVAVAVIYFVTLALSDYYHQKGVTLATSGQLQKAHISFEKAQLLSPRLDNNFYADAHLLLDSARLLSEADSQRNDLLDYANKKLKIAAGLNPYQPYISYLQGRVTEVQAGNIDVVIHFYQEALHKNPRFLPARLALARLYQQHNKFQKSLAVLTAGLDYPYQSLTRDLLDYIQLTAETAAQQGKQVLADKLSARYKEYRELYQLQQKNGPRRPSQRY